MSGIQLTLAAGGGTIVNPLAGGTFADVSITPTDATATLSVNPDGTISGSGATQPWMKGGGTSAGANRYVKATVTAGVTPSTGTVGSVQNLGVTRTWTNVQTAVGTRLTTLLIEIFSDAAGTNLLTSGTFNLNAEESL